MQANGLCDAHELTAVKLYHSSYTQKCPAATATLLLTWATHRPNAAPQTVYLFTSANCAQF
jgi:hypothetical protein